MDFWTPWVDASMDGAQGGLATRLSDPAERHSGLVIGGYESEHRKPVGVVEYSFAGLEPIISLHGVYDQARYSHLLRDDEDIYYDYDEVQSVAGLSIQWPRDRADYYTAVTLGYRWSTYRTLRRSAEKYADRELTGDTAPFDGNDSTVWWQAEYLNATAFPRSHSLEDGRYLSLAAERSDTHLGGDRDQTRLLMGWAEYLSLPWGMNHVLKIEGHYGTSSGDEFAQSAFGLGGFGDTISEAIPGVPRSLMLRGYGENTQVGTDIVKAGAAYRFPIKRIHRGVSATGPLYWHQWSGELFYEGGRAKGAEPAGAARQSWLNAYGLEINLGMTVLRWIDVAPGLGVVYAPDRVARLHEDDDKSEDRDETWQVYFSLRSRVAF